VEVEKCVERDGVMTTTEPSGTVERIIESGREAEEFALAAVRKFLDAIDSVFPDVGQEWPRRKIIDSAFKMTEQLVDTWTQLAEKIPDVVRERRRRLPPPRRMRARKVTAKKAPAKKVTAKKAAKRTTRKVAKRQTPAKKVTAKKAAKRTTRKVAKRQTSAKKVTAKKAAKRTTRKVAKRRTPA